MGYRRQRRVLHLVFAEPSAYAGLEVKVRAMSFGDFYAYTGLERDQQEMLAEHLVSWNVEDEDGTPVPATLEGIRSREVDEIKAIKRAWTDAMTEVPEGDPLALSSTSGLPEGLLDLADRVELPAST